MKKILIYSQSSKDIVGETYRALAEGFNKCGYNTIVIDVNDKTYLKKIMDIINNDEIYFSLGHNEYGVNLNFNTGEGLYEKINYPHVALLGDAPYNSVTTGLSQCKCNNLIIGVRDETHLSCVEFDKSYKSKYKMKFFLPLGASINADINNIELKKDIDVLYSAIYYGMPKRFWNELALGVSGALKKILNDVADYLEKNAVTVYDGFKKVLNDRELTDSVFLKATYPYFNMMYIYTKTYRRVNCLKMLAGLDIKIDVCDKSWESVSFADKLCIRNTNYAQTLELYKRTKILLQEMAEFNCGSHNRVFDATLSGAAIVSEYSSYLDKKFKNDYDIKFYDWNNDNYIYDSIKYLLDNEARRKAIVYNAFDNVKKSHMPEHRAMRILEVVDLYYSGLNV